MRKEVNELVSAETTAEEEGRQIWMMNPRRFSSSGLLIPAVIISDRREDQVLGRDGEFSRVVIKTPTRSSGAGETLDEAVQRYKESGFVVVEPAE